MLRSLWPMNVLVCLNDFSFKKNACQHTHDRAQSHAHQLKHSLKHVQSSLSAATFALASNRQLRSQW